jgi:hypothetical protein
MAMARRYYFLLTSLPTLPELGEPPPVALGDFYERVAQASSALPMIEALLLEQDLVLREAALAGEIERPEPVVLTAEQMGGQEPLPEFLTAAPEQPRRIVADVVWQAYYRHVHRLAVAETCRFARQWVGFEVALRNALAVTRARTLELDPHGYLVAEELADGDAAVDEIVSAWSAAADPLSALQVLDERRFRWIDENAQYFSFALDELAAYARKLVLVNRWHKLTREQAVSPGTKAT